LPLHACDRRRAFTKKDKAFARAANRDDIMRGAEDFSDWLAEKLARRGRKDERASERRETDQALAERVVREALRKIGWTETDLKRRKKGDGKKLRIARQLREQTPMSRQWIATRLHMGSASYLSALLKCQ
jgi:putative transposase